ncbi:MAG: SxtJ family membrane protein [Xanthomonadales bacterium]|nr:SxtJ family membrane protein [Xanthomonadales bacterium]
MTHQVDIPDRPGLRQFGLMFAAVLAVLFGVVIAGFRHGWTAWHAWPLWPWIVAGMIAAWALVHPASLKWLYRPWMRFAVVAGWINTRLIMLLLFYLVMLPIGLVMRLFGHDPMRRRFDPDAGSYRVESDKPSPGDLEKPF